MITEAYGGEKRLLYIALSVKSECSLTSLLFRIGDIGTRKNLSGPVTNLPFFHM